MTNVVRNLNDNHFGVLVGEHGEFQITGDLKVAYEVLKDMFETKKDSKSGPIKPMSKEERTLQENQPIVNTLEELMH